MIEPVKLSSPRRRGSQAAALQLRGHLGQTGKKASTPYRVVSRTTSKALSQPRDRMLDGNDFDLILNKAGTSQNCFVLAPVPPC